MMGHFSPKQLQKNDALCILADVFWFEKEKKKLLHPRIQDEKKEWENQELRKTKRQNRRSTLSSRVMEARLGRRVGWLGLGVAWLGLCVGWLGLGVAWLGLGLHEGGWRLCRSCLWLLLWRGATKIPT